MKFQAYFGISMSCIMCLVLILPHGRCQVPSSDYEFFVPGFSTKEAPKTAEELALEDAKRDVKTHVNPVLWFSMGCVFPIIGAGVSQLGVRTIPTARLLGKSPEYMAFYADYYKIEMKKQRFTWALSGCLTGTAVNGCISGIIYWYNRTYSE